MRYYEIVETILNELTNTNDIGFGNFTIRLSTQPDNAGNFLGLGFHNKDRDVRTGKIAGSSQEEVIDKIKSAIRQLRYTAAQQSRPDIKLSDVQKSEAAFNVNFTNEVLEGVPTAVRFGNEGGPYVDVMTREYFEEFGNDAREMQNLGFTRLALLQSSARTEDSGRAYHTSMTPSRVEKLGLDFNGRYTLDKDNSVHDDMFTRYRMHLDSHVQHPHDAFTLGVPGVTIAAWIKKPTENSYDDLEETATAGASSAGSVATVVGGLGAGFDPDGEWRSVYPSRTKKKDKMTIIRRPPLIGK